MELIGTLEQTPDHTRMSTVDPEVFRLIKQMTRPASDPGITGEPPDPSKLDDLALGDLWAIASSIPRIGDDGCIDTLAARTATNILVLGRTRKPTFSGSACRDYLLVLAADAEQKTDDAYGFHQDGILKSARFALKRCAAYSLDGFGMAAMRLLAATKWAEAPVMSVALARFVGETTVARVLDTLMVDMTASPLLLEEARIASCLSIEENLTLAEIIQPDISSEDHAKGTSSEWLARVPLYAAFAETGLATALRQVRRIHAGAVPYASDKAFSLQDSAVIARLARVALNRDEAWLPPLLNELFHKVSLAPTAARTVPSQSVAIALGHVIQAFPTPEAIGTLRDVLATIRHAGVAKKLRRNLPLAERGLANRPSVALRLPLDRLMTKAELSTLARSLEAGLAVPLKLPYKEWRLRFGDHPQTRKLAGCLVWRTVDEQGHARDVIPTIEGDAVCLRDVTGATVEPDVDGAIGLWHPSDASAEERNAWRDRIMALCLRQPFKQMFREHYEIPDDERMGCVTTMFSGHTVAIHPFLGLARREGWVLGYDHLTRVFGRWNVTLDLTDHLFPGASGATVTRHIAIHASRGNRSVEVRLGDLPAATLSEILRAVDLLVSAAGIAMIDVDRPDQDIGQRRDLHDLGCRPLGATAILRKDALRRLLQRCDGLADLRFDKRHLRLGPYAIHLATARVTRDGEPFAIEATTAPVAMPWLPYEDRLLYLIVSTVLTLSERFRA